MTAAIPDLAAAIGDGRVWVALGLACLAGLLLLLVGVLIARRVGLLDPEGDPTETFSVGLSLGLVAFAAAWASIASAGGSVFVPIAAAIVLAIAVGRGSPSLRLHIDRRSARVGVAAAFFLVAIGLLYATTIAPSPRDGYQPVEFFDVGYYSVLGADLAATGRESIYGPAGFAAIPGLPVQTWYHWGELWLAAAAIDLSGVSPLHARHLIVLPLILLAAATMVGTLVRRLVSPSTEFYVIAVLATVFLAPIPVLRDENLEWFARSLVISITQYGLVVVVILLGIYIAVRRRPAADLANAVLAGAIGGALIATHIGLAATIVAGIAATLLATAGRFVRSPRAALAPATTALQGSGRWASVVALTGLATLVWGLVTGHGLGGLAPIEGVVPFDWAWQRSVVETAVGAGVVLVAPIAWFWVRREQPATGGLVITSLFTVVAGVVAWGALVADLNTFHLLFGAIVAVLTPVSIVVLLAILGQARRQRKRPLATAVLILGLGQVFLAGLISGAQLQAFGPLGFSPTPVDALAALRALPPGSKAAYGCDVLENFAPWDASLVSIDAHTGVRMVPMCFIADRARRILGRELDPEIESPFFKPVPQRMLYPDASAIPAAADVRAFLATHGIGYIYADAAHPNSLVPQAIPVFSADGLTIYRIE
jgi:hypothetical protein